jgi:hypothetical protein
MTEQLADVLRRVLSESDDGWTKQPGVLRSRLNAAVGADATALRPRIHQLVVAADEKIPARLRSAGADPASIDELSSVLAAARGWTQEAARSTVVTWATALGLVDSVVHVPDLTAAPDLTLAPDPTALPEATELPTPAPLPEPTELPTPAPLPVPLPPAAPAPVALLPVAPRPVAPRPVAPAAAMPAPAAVATPPSPIGMAPPELGKKARRNGDRMQAFLGVPVDGAYLAVEGGQPNVAIGSWLVLVVSGLISAIGLFGDNLTIYAPGRITFAIAFVVTVVLRNRLATRWVTVGPDGVRIIEAKNVSRTQPVQLLYHGPFSDLTVNSGSSLTVGGQELFLWFGHRELTKVLGGPTR